ncbi:isochorismatase family protein, partial [Bacillus vallismortis]|nr:isochorismatase family protein [Bacillus vallismortis]
MMNTLNIDFQKTALVIIDLQKGIVPIDQSGQVVPNTKKLIDEFRKHNGFISFVNVAF